MIDILAFLLASGVGFGLSCWIFGTLLDKSNNMGDYKGERREYNAFANFKVRSDKMNKSEYSSFLYRYSERIDNGSGPSGTQLVRRMTDEERKQQKKAEVPRGAFVSEENGIASKKSFVDAYDKWEKENSSLGNLSGVFKPLNEDDADRAGF